jgi:hypothetical protein
MEDEKEEKKEEIKLDIIELQHQHEVDDFQMRNTYRSCCLETDRRALQYFTKVFICLILLGFSMGMIITNTDECAPLLPMYSSIITGIMGYFATAPKIDNDEQKE